VVFDIGGVLSAPEGAVPQVAGALGLPVDQVEPAYWGPRDAYDRGGGLAEYWTAVGRSLGLELSAEQAVDLDGLDARRWGALAPGSAALLAEVTEVAVAGGTRLAVLSNAPRSLAEVVRASRWSEAFAALLFSCDLRAAKPETQVYAAVEQALGLPGAQLAFFDDRPVNVEAARARGWRAHLWQGADQARHQLVELGVLDG